jgi:hypothetical protein
MHNQLSRAYAFLGNSLLAPMTQTGDYGLDPSFWESFPSFGNKGIVTATALMRERVRSFAANTPGSWADDLMHVICDVEPNGYFAGLVGLVCALLRFDGEGLAI